MDELLLKDNTKKEIIATLIASLLWIIGIMVFAFVTFDLMYIIINAAMLVITVIILIHYLIKMKNINKTIGFYTSDDFVPTKTIDILKRDYFKYELDEIFEQIEGITCYSTLQDNIITLELETNEYILFIQINEDLLTYAVSAKDDSFYNNMNELKSKVNKIEFSDDYFRQIDGDEEIRINSIDKEKVYEFIKEFIVKKRIDVDHLFKVYNEHLHLIKNDD